MSVKAILFDVGGVILTEDAYYDSFLEITKNVVREYGYSVTDNEFDEAVRACILSFVPSLGQALAWYFTKPDIEKHGQVLAEIRRHRAQWESAYNPELSPFIEVALRSINGSYILALAGNASPNVRNWLDRLGVLNYFEHQEVSGDIGLGKPDPRFFEHILQKCGVSPCEALMIGDRLDNDIVPARMMGMKTIWVRTGLYRILEPRVPAEIPDACVETVAELPSAIASLTSYG